MDKRSFLESTIKKGIKDKSFRGDLDSLKTGYYIFQTIMGLLQRMSYTSLPNSDEAVTFDDITTAVIEMIINSIKNTESNK
ncbi:hypothetical protein CLORY_31600 [Clostridium oryzae]|uniref:Uncharacterized protein n=1 Tax=Clostridium oryzae TaxID=1450648 RepID=A0A1V4II77_9CLOT|nr:hypothetical protein CLORY_31600 [Clostridium oryzae]